MTLSIKTNLFFESFQYRHNIYFEFVVLTSTRTGFRQNRGFALFRGKKKYFFTQQNFFQIQKENNRVEGHLFIQMNSQR